MAYLAAALGQVIFTLAYVHMDDAASDLHDGIVGPDFVGYEPLAPGSCVSGRDSRPGGVRHLIFTPPVPLAACCPQFLNFKAAGSVGRLLSTGITTLLILCSHSRRLRWSLAIQKYYIFHTISFSKPLAPSAACYPQVFQPC